MLIQKRESFILLLHGNIFIWLSLFLINCDLQPLDSVKVNTREIFKDNSIRTYYNFAAHRKKCKEKAMEDNASAAGFIFTGTIRDVHLDPRGHEEAEVEVKRVIKGSSILDQLPVSFVKGKYASVQHRTVKVHGVAHPEICINTLRRHDTWIFFTNLVTPGELFLNSSLVRLSLANIIQSEAAVKDKGSTSSTPKAVDKPVSSSCEWRFCPFGGHCVVNNRTQTAECRCVETCPEDVLSPVCGSDKVTYDSECRLRMTSCAQQRHIRVVWNESCESHDLCQNVKCGFGARCVPSVDKRSAFCQCPEECSAYGSAEDESSPVCSEDGTQYDSLCHLRKASCRDAIDILIRNSGACDPCWNVRCDLYAVCTADEFKRPHCTCLSNCSDNDRLVCGSNDRTYRNRCEMELAACREQRLIFVAYNGSCVNPCDGVICKYGAQCMNGTCSCPTACPTDGAPVCASDQTTYQSECDMLNASCYIESPLYVLHVGECLEMSGSDDICDVMPCQFGGRCERFDGDSGRCVCNFECGAVRSLVCGSDGVTYNNECLLKEAACRSQVEIRIQMAGDCQGFEEDLCDGKEALENSSTMQEYDCSPGKEICPAESYCHIIGETARCCPETVGQPNSLCIDTTFGCCPDGTTVATGPAYAGCSSGCRCHPLGSLFKDCDPETGQCQCKTGVGGPVCDRCEPSFFGMQKIAEGNLGCIPCECDYNGSIREDCEQMTGQCICKPLVFGSKCNICSDGTLVTEAGCPGMTFDNWYFSTNREEKNISEKLTEIWTPGTSIPEVNYYHLPTTRENANDLPPLVDYRVPSFSGMSYIQLQKLEHGVLELSIEIEFRSLALDGILLYTGQNADGKEDFISVSLKNGYVEFRYDLGSGSAMLRSNKQITLKKLHKVTAQRYGKDGLLKLDDGSEASAVSPGALRSLNIEIPLYLGYIPNLTEQISRNIGTERGFVGCIQFLRIASTQLNKQYELAKASEDIESDNRISECDLQSCKTVLCENGGICSHLSDTNYTCTCPIDYTGALCESRMVNDL